MSTPQCGHMRPSQAEFARLGNGAFALEYARLGLSVFAVKPLGKFPLPGSHGHRDGTTDPARIAEMWTGNRARNVAIATGQPSLLLVVDLDRKNGNNGPAEFAWWLSADGLELPHGIPYADTPNGGRHIWLRLPPGRSVQSRNGVLPGTDIKADGGFALAYPSALARTPLDRSGGTTAPVPVQYGWRGGCPCQAPLAAPELLDALGTLHGSAAGGGGAGCGDGDLPPTEELLTRGLEPGQRNRQMYRLACREFRRHGISDAASAAVAGTCRAVWRVTPQTPTAFSWAEAAGRIASARAFVAGQQAAEDSRNAEFLRWLHGRALA